MGLREHAAAWPSPDRGAFCLESLRRLLCSSVEERAMQTEMLRWWETADDQMRAAVLFEANRTSFARAVLSQMKRSYPADLHAPIDAACHAIDAMLAGSMPWTDAPRIADSIMSAALHTTINGAIAYARTMSAADAQPASILLMPGTYLMPDGVTEVYAPAETILSPPGANDSTAPAYRVSPNPGDPHRIRVRAAYAVLVASCQDASVVTFAQAVSFCNFPASAALEAPCPTVTSVFESMLGRCGLSAKPRAYRFALLE